jgi:arylsulfatase A-like enzyme
MKFESCFANGGTTAVSFPSMFESIFYDMYDGNKLPDNVPTISEVFSSSGYHTAGINAANPNLTEEFGYSRGFDHFVDFIHDTQDEEATPPEKVDSAKKTEPELKDRILDRLRNHKLIFRLGKYGYILLFYRFLNTYRKARNYMKFVRGKTPNSLSNQVTPTADRVTNKGIEWIEDQRRSEKPFFIWLHYMDPHAWYDPKSEFVEELYRDDVSKPERFKANRVLMSASPFRGQPDIQGVQQYLETLKKLYLGSVREVDSSIGRILEYLKNSGLKEETVIAITSDHGEEFLEHGNVQHSGQVHTETTHVPFVVSGPDVPNGSKPSVCHHLDLGPTLLELADIEQPNQYLGTKLLGRGDDERTFSNLAVSIKPNQPEMIVARDQIYTMVSNTTGSKDFYNRDEDYYEQNPIADGCKQEDKFLAAIDEYQGLCEQRSVESETIAPSEEISDRLEDLGYLS